LLRRILQSIKKESTQIWKYIQVIEEGRTLLNSFYKASITLILEEIKNNTKMKKIQKNSLISVDIRCSKVK
jgi:tRNA A37 threonylcarbamoyladenosine synthetase subunit TsaC/SUA5/YrdC